MDEEKNTKLENDSPYPKDYFDSLIKQIASEYELAWQHQAPKIEKALNRLKLYNNQKRDPDAVGDDLLFTVHQTVLASLYTDHLDVEFEGRDDGDADTGENLTHLAEYDYEKMGKDVMDYYWLWDTLFFGRAIIALMEFDRSDEFMCPIPELFDPMTFLRDPDCNSVNGDVKQRGQMRYGGREIYFTKLSLTKENGYFDIDDLKDDEEMKALAKQAREARDEASGHDTQKQKTDQTLGDNQRYGGLQWFTHWKGKKCIVTLANNRTKVIKYQVLEERIWPLIDRPMYPTAHDWDGTSIPDIVEDKQRQRAATLNLTILGMKSDLYPQYIYDEDLITNKADLVNFAFNKFVGAKGDKKGIANAVMPMNKTKPAYDLVNFVLNSLDASAQRATATPEMQSGQISDEKRTLGELNLVASKVDTRYSLTAKVFGWSEKAYWRQWYWLYKKHFKNDIDEKMVRIAGALGSKWRGLTRENIISDVDPDVRIQSRTVSENRRAKDRIMLNGYAQNVLADPEAQGKRYFMKKLARLNGLTKDECDIIYPPTIDELNAEDENDLLNADEMVPVNPNDNHYEHLQVHNKAADTRAKYGHIIGHRKALMVQRTQPELFPELQPGQTPGLPGQPGQKPVTPSQMTPSAIASPTSTIG